MASRAPENSTSPLPILDPPVDLTAEVVRWLFPAYIFLMLAGFFVLRTNLVMPAGNELTHDRAIFTSINAATLTGFQLSIHPKNFFIGGKIVLLVLTFAGTLFTSVVGGIAVKRILRLAWPDRRLVQAAVVIQVIVMVMGAIASPVRPGNVAEPLVGGMLQSLAAWGNSGLYVDVSPSPASAYTHLVLLPLAVLGGLGITVVIEIVDALVFRRPLSRHAKIVLQMSALLYIVGLVAFSLLQFADLDAVGRGRKEPWGEAFARLWSTVLTNASITSVNCRTAGLNVVSISEVPRSMAFATILLMLIGASPAGTGGGLKTTTLYELVTGPWKVLRGQPLSRTFGIAATWLGIFLGALVCFQIALLWAEPQMPGDRVLFVTASALANVGLAHDVLSMTRSSLVIVSAAMLFGRLAPLLVLWWMADTTKDADVAVG